MKRTVPWILLSVRLLIVPLFVMFPNCLNDLSVLWLYMAAFVTDYFDGVSARYLGIATPSLRKTDSAADTVFHLALAYVLFLHHPEVFRRSAIALVLFLVTAAAWYVIDAFRWHRIAGFHTYSAKVFSVALMVWIVLLLIGRNTGPLFAVILVFGALSNIEGIIISLRLRKDCTDVPTLFHVHRAGSV